mmetsp:Transcript_73016/g.173946  ORF Transcript_73016/g.173946 Transcript_73016/m.173946 type:complete len:352 (-) Transcript_73016:693-1748(-)
MRRFSWKQTTRIGIRSLRWKRMSFWRSRSRWEAKQVVPALAAKKMTTSGRRWFHWKSWSHLQLPLPVRQPRRARKTLHRQRHRQQPLVLAHPFRSSQAVGHRHHQFQWRMPPPRLPHSRLRRSRIWLSLKQAKPRRLVRRQRRAKSRRKRRRRSSRKSPPRCLHQLNQQRGQRQTWTCSSISQRRFFRGWLIPQTAKWRHQRERKRKPRAKQLPRSRGRLKVRAKCRRRSQSQLPPAKLQALRWLCPSHLRQWCQSHPLLQWRPAPAPLHLPRHRRGRPCGRPRHQSQHLPQCHNRRLRLLPPRARQRSRPRQLQSRSGHHQTLRRQLLSQHGLHHRSSPRRRVPPSLRLL